MLFLRQAALAHERSRPAPQLGGGVITVVVGAAVAGVPWLPAGAVSGGGAAGPESQRWATLIRAVQKPYKFACLLSAR